MKTPFTQTGISLRKSLAILATALFAAVVPANAVLIGTGGDAYLGAAGWTSQWAVFALSGGLTVADTTLQGLPYDGGPGTPTIQGNIGAGGGQKITLSGRTRVEGDAYIRSGGSLVKSGTSNVQGTVHVGTQDALVNQVVADANAARIAADALANNSVGASVTAGSWGSFGSTLNQSTSFTLTDTLSNGHYVFDLTDFILSGGATLTLDGTSSSTFVFNISGKFALAGGKIVLNNVLPANVLFNVLDTTSSTISMTSGAIFEGTLLATNRTLNISGGSQSNGQIIAGKVSISGGSKINKQPFVSP